MKETRRHRWIHPFELLVVAGAILAMLFLRLQGMRMDWRTFDYILSPIWRFLPKALLVGVGSYLVYGWLRREDLRGYLRQVRSPAWLGLWLRLWVASAVMTYGYFWIKVTIPLVNERLWDMELWRLDVLLHLGLSPSIFATELFAGTPLPGLIDAWYGFWITTVFYSIAFFTAFPDDGFRRRFMTSCVLLWTLGGWFYLSVPALGPAYVFPDVWQEVRAALPVAEGTQAMLWENYQRILAGRSGALNRFNPTRGIAAMPSLHVAAHWLFALWARRRAPRLFLPFAIATGFTFVGSVLTGWHYAVDGYAGLLLAWGVYRLSLLIDREPKPPAEEEAYSEEGEVSAPVAELASSDEGGVEDLGHPVG